MAKSGMNSRKKSVLNNLAEGANISEAAIATGVAVRTIYNWLDHDNDFKAALDRIQSVCVDSILVSFMASQRTAQETINELMTDSSVSASVRLRAAELVIDRNIQLYELRNVERRLCQLEKINYQNEYNK